MKTKEKRLKRSNWYERPLNICGKCGYHKDSCVCKAQKVHVEPKITHETSIDFYA